jgi:anti-sigma regulatory factor (Ser/Thr protein kinase)
MILFGVDMSRSRAQFVVRDHGEGFDVAKLPDPKDASHLSADRKRGITLIRHFMDEVSFNETGNEIRMSIDLQKQMAPTI